MTNTKKTKKRKSKFTHKSLAMKAAWDAMSIYVRVRDGWRCITCGRKGDKYSIQAGHFISRSYNAIKFDERNVNGQCKKCNVLLGGCWDIYYERMVEKYSQKVVDILMAARNQTKQFTIPELLELEKYFKEKLKSL